MSPLSTSTPGVRQATFRFHCIACGHLSDSASQNFRCPQCKDLLEITYPHWKEAGPEAQNLRSIWRQRRLSQPAFHRDRIASYKKPKFVEFVDELPLLGGRTDYDALDARFGGGGYPGGRNVAT